MAEQEAVVIVDEAGVEHEFPPGFDPRRAGAIVQEQSKKATLTKAMPDLPPSWPRDRFGNPVSTPDHTLDETGRPVNWADRTFTPENLDKAGIAADLISLPLGIVGGPKPMGTKGVTDAPGILERPLRFMGDVIQNYDITKPAKPLGDLMKWGASKFEPKAPGAAPVPADVPISAPSHMSGLRLRMADEANSAPRMQPLSAEGEATVDSVMRGRIPAPPQEPMTAERRIQWQREKEGQVLSPSPRMQPLSAEGAALAESLKSKFTPEQLATLEGRKYTPPPAMRIGTLAGKAPTMQDELVKALEDVRTAPPPENTVTAPPAPGADITVAPGAYKMPGKRNPGGYVSGNPSKPQIQVAPETMAAMEAIPEPTPVLRIRPSQVATEEVLPPSKSHGERSAHPSLTKSDLRRGGYSPDVKITKMTPEEAKRILQLRGQAHQGHITDAEIRKAIQVMEESEP